MIEKIKRETITFALILVLRELNFLSASIAEIIAINSRSFLRFSRFIPGTPSLTGTTTLMIEVENSNDKAPYFTPETQRAEVTEDTPIGTVFATLKATDPDSTNLEALNFAISEPITAIDRNGQRVNDSKSFKVRETF